MSDKVSNEKVLPRDKDVHPPTTDGGRTREVASGDDGPEEKKKTK